MIQPWSIGIYARQCGMSTCHVFVIESNDARTLGKRGVQKPSPFPSFVSSSFIHDTLTRSQPKRAALCRHMQAES